MPPVPEPGGPPVSPHDCHTGPPASGGGHWSGITRHTPIGKSLQGAKEVYEDAMGKLKTADGNLIGQVEKLKRLGVQSAKSLPKNLLYVDGVDERGLALTANAEESEENQE